jgi:hypothetical protein
MLYQLSDTTSRLEIKFVRFRSKYITGPIRNKLLHGLHSMARSHITYGGVGLKLQTCIRKKFGLNLSWVAVYPDKYSVVFLANMPWSSSFKYLTTDQPRPSSLLSGRNTDLTSKFTERLCIPWSSRQRETAQCGSAGLRFEIECTPVTNMRVEHWDCVVSSRVRDCVSQAGYHNREWRWPF